jgi:hypothetical protein
MVREAAERLGMRIVGIMTHGEVPEAPNVDALLMAGTFAEDVELVRRLRARPPRSERWRPGSACSGPSSGAWPKASWDLPTGGGSALPDRCRAPAGGEDTEPPGHRFPDASSRGGGRPCRVPHGPGLCGPSAPAVDGAGCLDAGAMGIGRRAVSAPGRRGPRRRSSSTCSSTGKHPAHPEGGFRPSAAPL